MVPHDGGGLHLEQAALGGTDQFGAAVCGIGFACDVAQALEVVDEGADDLFVLSGGAGELAGPDAVGAQVGEGGAGAGLDVVEALLGERGEQLALNGEEDPGREYAEVPAGQKIIDRSTVNAWHDDRVREAIEATGRRKLIFAGVSLEVCAALPAISATAAGYDAYAAVDASGTFSQAKREAGLLRMQQAGVIVSDYATLLVEALADNALPEAGALYAALDMPFAVLVGQISAAHRA